MFNMSVYFFSLFISNCCPYRFGSRTVVRNGRSVRRLPTCSALPEPCCLLTVFPSSRQLWAILCAIFTATTPVGRRCRWPHRWAAALKACPYPRRYRVKWDITNRCSRAPAAASPVSDNLWAARSPATVPCNPCTSRPLAEWRPWRRPPHRYLWVRRRRISRWRPATCRVPCRRMAPAICGAGPV